MNEPAIKLVCLLFLLICAGGVAGLLWLAGKCAYYAIWDRGYRQGWREGYADASSLVYEKEGGI